MPLRTVSVVPSVLNSPEPYALNHPDRIKKFSSENRKVIFQDSADGSSPIWRHELDHDAESAFSLLVSWVLGAQPVQCPKETLDARTWASLMGEVKSRIGLINDLTDTELEGATHSFYRPVWPLLNALASILVVDRLWLEETDTRNDPEYVCEAFQRLIFQFILDHRNKEFMTHKVDRHHRDIEQIPQIPSLTATPGQRRSTGKRKRSSPEP